MTSTAAAVPTRTDPMAGALAQARLAAEAGEVPVGAVLVVGGQIVASAYNRTIANSDPTAHAEIEVLREGARLLGNHRTRGTLYATLEPCAMCMGAMVQARIDALVFAARDPKAGAAVSLYELGTDRRLNHRFDVSEGPGCEEAQALLREFFAARRRG